MTSERTEDGLMARSDNEVTIEFLQVFANAWNRHDADALIEFMAPDCVYETSSGPNVCGPGIKDKNRFARDLPVSGNRFRMLSGSEPGISLSGTVGCRNGRSPAPIKTVRG